MSAEYRLTASTVPSDLQCVISNADWQALVGTVLLTLPDGTFINVGNTTPSPENRAWPWFRKNADGTPDKTYTYAGGQWLAPHPWKDMVDAVIMYTGLEANIPTFDGGEVGVVGTTTGPFWEKLSAMDGKVPLGPGTLQPSATVVALAGTGGVDQHVLTGPEMPNPANMFNNLNFVGLFADVAAASGTFTVTTVASGTTHRTVAWMGNSVAHPNMPPYYALWFIRKTARQFYRAP